MKTTKLSKNFAALCLSMAAFCAAQSAFAEVVVPDWQNSYTSAPTGAFYLYNTAQSKFATNSLTLLDDESKATTWTYSSKKLGTNGQYFARGSLFAGYPLTIGNNGIDFTLDYTQSDDKWGIYFTSGKNYYVQAATQLQFGEGNAKIYEWYFISTTQYSNHNAIVAAKNGAFAEANQLLEAAEEGDAKTALSTAVTNAETTINGIGIEDSEATTTINNVVTELNNAINAYKQGDLGQYVEALQATLNDAATYEGPEFDNLKKALSAANAAMNATPKVAGALDAANKNLVDALELARTIVADEAYATYLSSIATIGENIAAASEYTGYANDLSGIKDQAEEDFLAITSVAGLTTINNTLKSTNDAFGGKLNLCNAAWTVATQAAAVGYDSGFATVKAWTSNDITLDNLKTTVTNIRKEAKTSAVAYCSTHTKNVDMTIFINNNSFELGDNTGWTLEGGLGEKRGDTEVKVNSAMTDPSAGCDGTYMYNTWNNDGTKGYGISQEITGLPNGKYRLEALLTSTPENKIYLAVGKSRTNNVPTKVTESGVTSPEGQFVFVPASCEFTVTNGTATNGTATIGASGDAWFRADNFRLSLVAKAYEQTETDTKYAYDEGVIPFAKVTREIKAGQWTTLCLPMECAIPQYVTLYEVTGETQDGEHVSITVKASDDNIIKRGKPYIVNYPATHKEGSLYVRDVNNPQITEFTATAVELAEAPTPEGNYIPFTGLFSATELNAGDIYVSTSTDASAAAPVYKELSETAANKTMKGFRAYFKVPAGANSNVRFITDDVITSIMQTIEGQQKANGTYDLSGRKANTLQKGTYVIDGKKVIIK